MTKNQKAFAEWLEKFCETCRNHGGFEIVESTPSRRFDFTTRFGKLSASAWHLDYAEQSKHGFVSIYMRWGNDADLKELSKHLGGELNQFSGKWNIHFSGHKKNISYARESALEELERRLRGVML